MPFEVNWEPRLVYKRFFGYVTGEEFLASTMQLQNDARWDGMHGSVNDFLDVTGYSVNLPDVRRFSAYGIGAAHSNPGLKIAVLTTDDGIRNLVRQYLAPFDMAFFTTPADARAWIETGELPSGRGQPVEHPRIGPAGLRRP